jgi:hypothetical protein
MIHGIHDPIPFTTMIDDKLMVDDGLSHEHSETGGCMTVDASIPKKN